MIEALSAALARRVSRRLEQAQRAAVLVPIVVGSGGDLGLLLTRRTEDLPSHPGQVAFPGGLVRPGEEDPARTALREAEEEIGLQPERVRVLGLLDDVTARTGAVAVTPVVGAIADLPPLRPQTKEVARIFTIPFMDLVQPGRWTSKIETRAGREQRIYFFEHEGEVLWGLSARITLQLLELAGLGVPAKPAPPGV
jgi:8-oxo-dGTP pyrophosphatase MutT (NUDIX family)